METMNGKVAMVTGAAAGIGSASAEAFEKAGTTVVSLDINEPKEQIEKLISKGYKAVAYHCDVSDTQSVKEIIDCAAIDYAAKGIRINATCPGVIRTPMAEELIRCNPDLEKELIRDIPAGRLGKPEEIANTVLWLCSPQASFVNGHALLMDGTFSIH